MRATLPAAWLVFVGVPAAWVLAMGAYVLGYVFYPILVLPAAWGLALGLSLRLAVRLGRCLWLERCPSCEAAPVRLLLEAAPQDSKGGARRRKLYDATLSRESFDALVCAGGLPAGKS